MSFKNYKTMDPQLLLGLVNTALRNDCEDFDDLVKRHNLDDKLLKDRLRQIGQVYHKDINQFRVESAECD